DADARKDAMCRLEALEGAALAPLREASKKHADADVRLRAVVVAAAIHKKLFGELRIFEVHKGWVVRVVVAPDGKHAVSAGDDLRVWDLDAGKCLRTFGRGGWGLDVSRDGKRVICSRADRGVWVYELETGKELARFLGHT